MGDGGTSSATTSGTDCAPRDETSALPREEPRGSASCLLESRLIGAGLSHQRTRSWKWSPDPDFQAKAERVLGLYRECPQNGVVICFDEMGPIQLIPHQGSGWARQKRPERLRATYSKHGGVRYLFGAYDVHATVCTAGCARTRAATRSWRSTANPDALPVEGPDLPDRRQPLRPQDPGHPPMAQDNNIDSCSPPPTPAS